MTTIEKSIDVKAPVRRTYNQWTQFESFPSFMEGVERIRQITPTRTHWEVNIGGVRREFDAEITEQHPDERVAWKTVDGPEHGGVVTFHRIDDQTTRVNLQMEYQPETLTEKAGAALGAVGTRVKGDLERFKQFIEERGQETGGWRGEVERSPQQGETGRLATENTGTSAWTGETPGRTGTGAAGWTDTATTGRTGSGPGPVPPGTEADFAGEHMRPTFADDTRAPEGPDESVPRGRGGAGGMDPGPDRPL